MSPYMALDDSKEIFSVYKYAESCYTDESSQHSAFYRIKGYGPQYFERSKKY